ncbi:ergosterol 28 [Saccharata proteae CBS 121410]|uniref:Ergosterol 28 n=1 Tax=Saccharata proteae CBS 121410 TaxID=1314787 RepID=A0A9P4I2W2_9PEZI|nr:ergosterol 28 [Saccharata proteae CBS 121410]
MSSLWDYFPQHEGVLPKVLFFIGVAAVFNTIQSYTTLRMTSQVYLGPPTGPRPPGSPYPSPTTPLHSRTFGTWTALQGIVRMYAAYNIESAAVYQLCMWTNAIAVWHFYSEWLVFGSTRWNKGLAGPLVVSVTGLVWMWVVYGDYVQ